MFSVTINGNTIEELIANAATLFANKTGIAALGFPAQQPTPAVPQTNSIQPAPVAPTAPLAQTTPTAPTAPTAPTTHPNPPVAPAFSGVPAAPAPTYTLDQLARAGAALAQAGKIDDALALLAKYGVQTVNQLSPEHYGAFATELRALGAQL